jgi:hypothetical protein
MEVNSLVQGLSFKQNVSTQGGLTSEAIETDTRQESLELSRTDGTAG